MAEGASRLIGEPPRNAKVRARSTASPTLPGDEFGGYTVIGKVTSGLDQLVSGVTSAGESSGTGDGPPVVPTTITSVTVQ